MAVTKRAAKLPQTTFPLMNETSAQFGGTNLDEEIRGLLICKPRLKYYYWEEWFDRRELWLVIEGLSDLTIVVDNRASSVL